MTIIEVRVANRFLKKFMFTSEKLEKKFYKSEFLQIFTYFSVFGVRKSQIHWFRRHIFGKLAANWPVGRQK